MATILKDTREYVDFDLLFSRHPLTNNLAVKKRANAVRQSILHLMQLRSGDKPFHPEIKSPIYDYLFETASVAVQAVLESEIKKYLGVYEPRAYITQVMVSFPTVNTLQCDIYGVIVNTQEPISVSILADRLR